MANNPVSSPNSKSSISTFTPGTARAIRISSLLEKLIKEKSGSIDYSDMIDVLNDIKDIYAEHKKKHMIKASREYIKGHPQFNTTNIVSQLAKLEKWDSDYDKDKQEPVYFTLWEYYFRKNYLSEQLDRDFPLKMKIMSMAYYEAIFLNLYQAVAKDPKHRAEFCSRYDEVETKSCAENLVRALTETISYVNENFNNQTVTWSDLHQMGYPNVPFTRTPLRKIFDRSVPAHGGINTINVAAFRFFRFDEQHFTGTHSANLKIMSNMNGTVHYSLDTGISENYFTKHYFDMNERHLKNDLYKDEFPKNKTKEFVENRYSKHDILFKFKYTTTNELQKTEDL